MPTFHLIIKGKVQGVFFRASAKEMADKIGVKGWIKNTWDDHVEAMVTGEQPVIEKFIEWCREGPKKAIVTDVVATPKEETNFNDFRIVRF